MQKFILSVVMVGLVGCSHFQETPTVVQFPYASELLQKVQSFHSHAPASLMIDDVEEVSTRRVYFSALYHQYLTLGQHLDKKSDIAFCPQFHHDKIQTDSRLDPSVSLYQASHVEQEGKVYFPELAFSEEFSLSDYHQTIHSELTNLCENGASDNFYKFDNLVTHYSHKTSFHMSDKAMTSVLKIPVFANFYLVKMLEAPGVNFVSIEEKRFIKLTRTHWFETYISEARGMRSNFIKNKMVKR